MERYIRNIEYSTYFLDNNMVIYNIDKEFTKITGYTKEDIKNNKITQTDLIVEEDRLGYSELVHKCIQKKGEAYIEHRIKRKDGSCVYVYCLGFESIEDGKKVFVVKLIDIEKTFPMYLQQDNLEKEYREKNEKLYKAAKLDSLTSLLRRIVFEDRISDILKTNKKATLIMIDIDDFKNVNDTYGHNVGDEKLIDVAKILTESSPKNALISRLGGDEFAIYIPDNNKSNITKTINKIMSKKENYNKSTDVKISLSIGAKIMSKCSSFDDLYKEADLELYKAKENGKNCYFIKK